MVVPVFGAGRLRVTHPSAALTSRRIQRIPLDLHVLGTPPAFILSHDQTLRIFLYRGLSPRFVNVIDVGPSSADLPVTLQLLRSSHAALNIAHLSIFVKRQQNRCLSLRHRPGNFPSITSRESCLSLIRLSGLLALMGKQNLSIWL